MVVVLLTVLHANQQKWINLQQQPQPAPTEMLLLHETKPFKLPKTLKILQTLCATQPQKYLKLNFTPSGIDMSTLDDSSTILAGTKIHKTLFHSYIIQKDINLLFPLARLIKIMELAEDGDSTLTLLYENCGDKERGAKECTVRIYNAKSNQKLVVVLRIQEEFGEMISEKYEEPTNPVQYLDGLLGRADGVYCQFRISCLQFLRICKEFAQAGNKQVQLKYQTQLHSNKKYLTLSTPTQNGLKSLTLSEQKSPKQQAHLAHPRQIKQSFVIESLYKIARTVKGNQDLLLEEVEIFVEKGKCVVVRFGLGVGLGERVGVFVAMVEVAREEGFGGMEPVLL